MKKNNHTPDEKFMLRLMEEAEKKEEMDTPFDRYQIGKLAGLQERGVDATCKLLVQANFIKKASQTEIYITPHGEKLVRDLRLEY